MVTNHRHLFLKLGGLKVQDQGADCGCSGRIRCTFWLTDGIFSLCSQMAEGLRMLLSGVSFIKDTNPIRDGFVISHGPPLQINALTLKVRMNE